MCLLLAELCWQRHSISSDFADTTPNPLARFKEAADVTKRSSSRWKSDFIWNTNWKEALEFQEAEREARRKAQNAEPAKPVGALGLSRVLKLDE